MTGLESRFLASAQAVSVGLLSRPGCACGGQTHGEFPCADSAGVARVADAADLGAASPSYGEACARCGVRSHARDKME
jgi:hypothetical protein